MKNIEIHKESLEKELVSLKEEMRSVGRVNPENSKDWEGTPGNTENIDDADENSLADKFEEYEERNAVETELEIRFREVEAALLRIEKGGFGVCKICEKEIEDDRLEANPAAETCKEHLSR
jgi:DnaK suppressor protein